ncbi:MAG: cyclin-like protein [Monoraphidium minutum]|nr:MAG: cyclin-like protein [Monoraphidium minutum]
MDFDTSTHKARWLFDQDALAAKRAEVQQAAAESMKRSREPTPAADDAAAPPDAKKQRAEPPVSAADEALLRRYFELKIRRACEDYPLPAKVQATATAYFKRFFIRRSCLEHDPARIMPACIYLAAKARARSTLGRNHWVEEVFVGVEDYCKKMGVDQQAVLRTEVPLLQGLGFDLVVHSPYRALNGLMQELEDLRAARSPDLDAPLLAAAPEAVAKLRHGALKAVPAILDSDAPLLFPPGVLALAALRSGARSAGLACTRFLEHAARRAAAARADDRARERRQGEAGEGIPGGANPPPPRLALPGGGDGVGDGFQRLVGWMADVDVLVVAAIKEEAGLEQRAAEADRAIKLWRIAAAGGGGGGASQGGAAAGAAAGAVASGSGGVGDL